MTDTASNDQILRTIRATHWEQAKGHLRAMLQTHWDCENYDEIADAVADFVKYFEDKGFEE